MNRRGTLRRSLVTSVMVLIIWLVYIGFIIPVHADGGAPNLAYVASTSGISVIDVAQKKVTHTIPTLNDAHTILLSLDGRYLYVAQPRAERIAIVAASTGNIICTTSLPGKPSFLTLDANNNNLYAAGHGSNDIITIDATNCEIKRVFHTITPINGIALALADTNLSEGDATQLWATTARGIACFNTQTGQLVQTIALSEEPATIAIPPGKTVYVTTQQGTINAIDIATSQTVRIIAGGTYGPMDFDELTGEIYVPDAKNKQLVVLAPIIVSESLHQHEPQRTLHFKAAPTSIAITNDGQLGFVALNNGHVTMLDLPGKQQITDIEVRGNPHFIITGLYPPLVPLNLQEATLSGIIVSVIAYGLIALMLIGPTIYFISRYIAHSKNQIKPKRFQQ